MYVYRFVLITVVDASIGPKKTSSSNLNARHALTLARIPWRSSSNRISPREILFLLTQENPVSNMASCPTLDSPAKQPSTRSLQDIQEHSERFVLDRIAIFHSTFHAKENKTISTGLKLCRHKTIPRRSKFKSVVLLDIEHASVGERSLNINWTLPQAEPL